MTLYEDIKLASLLTMLVDVVVSRDVRNTLGMFSVPYPLNCFVYLWKVRFGMLHNSMTSPHLYINTSIKVKAAFISLDRIY